MLAWSSFGSLAPSSGVGSRSVDPIQDATAARCQKKRRTSTSLRSRRETAHEALGEPSEVGVGAPVDPRYPEVPLVHLDRGQDARHRGHVRRREQGLVSRIALSRSGHGDLGVRPGHQVVQPAADEPDSGIRGDLPSATLTAVATAVSRVTGCTYSQ
jgi:hypothetical protein